MHEDNSSNQRKPEKTRENQPSDVSFRADWLTPLEAVEETGIGRTRLYGFLTSGALPSAKVGRTRHIRRRDLDRFLEERMTGTSAAPTK